MISARDIQVQIGKTPILHGVDFTAKPGQVTAIVGPNGSGKSTLLKAICGDLPYAGRITLNGTDVANAKPWALAALRGVLPQASTLAFPFQAIEVVRIGLAAGTGGDREGRAAAALERVGLNGYAERYYQELSGGEQQRVQLARVVAQVWVPKAAQRPLWLMLDEPVSSLDIAHQLHVMNIARAFARAGGGVVAVMHDLNLTSLFADRVIVMAEGQVLAAGNTTKDMTDEVLSRAYGCDLRVNTISSGATPFILPHSAQIGA